MKMKIDRQPTTVLFFENLIDISGSFEKKLTRELYDDMIVTYCPENECEIDDRFYGAERG